MKFDDVDYVGILQPCLFSLPGHKQKAILMNRTTATILALVFSSQLSMAAQIQGAGAATCSAFNATATNSADETYFIQWALGYISRLNAASEEAGRVTLDLTPGNFGVESQRYFLRSYCSNYPSGSFVEAATALWNRLIELNGAGY